jgi:hypothetical protein
MVVIVLVVSVVSSDTEEGRGEDDAIVASLLLLIVSVTDEVDAVDGGATGTSLVPRNRDSTILIFNSLAYRASVDVSSLLTSFDTMINFERM